MIAGVTLTPLKIIEGPAGAVLHGMKASSPGYAGFGEAYFSQIHEGTTKSWRRHRETTMNLVVPIGAVRFVIHDDREGSASQGAFSSHTIGPGNYARLTVAPGLWLAFLGVGPGTSTILSIIDREHDPTESDTRDLEAIAYAW
jgi:dTDP-4-dehydrorhamnose 3,5-epimerase